MSRSLKDVDRIEACESLIRIRHRLGKVPHNMNDRRVRGTGNVGGFDIVITWENMIIVSCSIPSHVTSGFGKWS